MRTKFRIFSCLKMEIATIHEEGARKLSFYFNSHLLSTASLLLHPENSSTPLTRLCTMELMVTRRLCPTGQNDTWLTIERFRCSREERQLTPSLLSRGITRCTKRTDIILTTYNPGAVDDRIPITVDIIGELGRSSEPNNRRCNVRRDHSTLRISKPSK